MPPVLHFPDHTDRFLHHIVTASLIPRSKFPRDPWLLVALRRLGFHFQPAISPRNRYYYGGRNVKKKVDWKWSPTVQFFGNPPKIWIISMYLLETRILYLNAMRRRRRRRRRRLSSFPFPWSEEFSTTWFDSIDSISEVGKSFFRSLRYSRF